ncbi:hypothetical protein R5W24_000919 [Gemmata sp. JC717]|uniref:hypothetical protein n=1 Tax=Gemmata algarum TaxID=2975278 RepID=UPI0021BA7388|nr:hypothetical protein [Gemmata algarum]MDY3551839.1 hypothetical protein [Gemmata algarum]
MVMRNRNDGADARRWWDDLPPRVRTRVASPETETHEQPAPDTERLFSPGELVRDLSRLALLFFVIVVANMLFLVLVLALLHT